MDDHDILLSTAYFPPVQYLSKLVHYRNVWVEAEENFIKQTYRNRTIILAANGPEALIVPVEKGRGQKQKIKELRISYDTNWQHIHWQAIVSAYQSSPFFEILKEDFIIFFKKKYAFLFDFNQQILETILDILELEPVVKQTADFEAVPENCLNYRQLIHPKPQKTQSDPFFEPKPYTQVFNDKFGFMPNLSSLDLLFNCGSESYGILYDSFQRG